MLSMSSVFQRFAAAVGRENARSQLLAKGFTYLLSAVVGAGFSSALTLLGNPSTQVPLMTYLAVTAILSFVALAILIDVLIFQITKTFRYNISLDADSNVLDNSSPRKYKVKKIAFKYCSSIAFKATKSIVVIGPHFEKGRDNNNSTQISHDDYLDEGMTEAIRRHLLQPDSDFQYERIVQIEEHDFKVSREDQALSVDSFNNRSLAEHVKLLLEIKLQAPKAAISVVARPYIASFPSILIIDDRYVFFSLPTSALSLPLDQPVFDTVLALEDVTGKIPKEIKQIVLNFKVGGFQVVRVY